MGRNRRKGTDAVEDGLTAGGSTPVEAVEGDDAPGPGEEGGDELDGYRRVWDPVLDLVQDHPVVASVVGGIVALALVVTLVASLVGRAEEQRRPPRTTTTTTTSTTTTTTPGPRPALAALDTPVRPVVKASGKCGALIGSFRKLFTSYTSGARLDQAGTDELNRLLPRLDSKCDKGTATRFRNLELEVWLRHRPVELPDGVTTTTAPRSAPEEGSSQKGAPGKASPGSPTTTQPAATRAGK